MNSKGRKFARFEDWSSERSSSFEQQYSIRDGQYPRDTRPTFSGVVESFWRGIKRGSERIKSFKRKPVGLPPVGDAPRKESAPRKTIIDPQGQFLQTWNKIFVLSCVLSVALDPLFFYIPVWNDDDKCLDTDNTLAIIACVLRSITDAFYALHIIFKFRTAIIPPYSRVFGRGDLIDDPKVIAKRYLSTYFIIDILAILPLPQVVVFVFFRSMKTEGPWVMKEMLRSVIFAQYVPRLLRIPPLYVEVTRTSGIMTETAWAGAAYNLFLYMLASHVVGAFWYLFAIEREDTCWQANCKNTPGCQDEYFYCGKHRNDAFKNLSDACWQANCKNTTGCQDEYFYCGKHRHDSFKNLSDACPFIEREKNNFTNAFDFGIFLDVLQSGTVASTKFSKKFSYCFWWGLRNLSSLGQNLQTSTFVGEIVFAVFISIFGLVLFSLLIGNMQKYLQSTTVRVEEMRVRRTDAEQWMSHRMLPETLRERVRRYEQYKWLETRGVEEEKLIRDLPKDLRRDIKRHLCLDLLMKVPMFEKMDHQLWDPLFDRLKPVLYTVKSYIVREGDPVDEMLFIMRGNLATMTTNGGITGFFNYANLKAGDFCGEELLTWALDPNSSTKFPTSTRTVVAQTEVEAFALLAEDLKTVASQFRKLHSKELQHTFRFYSVQWKTWAACFIQSAWRRHLKRKQEKALREAEDRLQDALANEAGTSASLSATIYAARFAANLLRRLRRKGARNARVQQRVLQLMPQKPAEPNFAAEGH